MSSSQKEKLLTLIDKRTKCYERIELLHNLLPNIDQNNLNLFMVRYEQLDTYYSSFEEFTEEIITLQRLFPDEKSSSTDSIHTMKNVDEFYFAIKAFARKHKLRIEVGPASSNVAPTVPTSESRATAKLPKLQLPTFSGDLKDWPNFHSLFKSTIHSQDNLTGTEKLQYLRSFLQGTPLTLIEHLHLSNDNYTLAYNILVKRYQNKRTLASFYLNHILEFSPLQRSSLEGLRKHLEVFQTNVSALDQLNLVNVGDFFMFHFAFLSLDPETRKSFENKSSNVDVPSFESLMKFVQEQVQVFEISQQQLPKSSNSKNFSSDVRQPQKYLLPSSNFKPKSFVSTTIPNHNHYSPQLNKFSSNLPTNSSTSQCSYCKESHPLHHCPKFSSKPVSERRDIVRNLQKCFNCLNNHSVRLCNSHSRCRHCGKSHHTLLHDFPPSNATGNPHPHPAPPKNSNPARQVMSSANNNNSSSSTSQQSLSCQLTANPANSTVLLGTAQALISDTFGVKHKIRLVIDPGSMISCITESCVQSLGLSRHASTIDISGIGNSNITSNKGVTSCLLSSPLRPETNIQASAVILPRISGDLPTVPISQDIIKSFSSLTLADSQFHTPGKIDLLLGADVYSQILVTQGPTIIPGEPTAINSVFGWILLGKAATTVHAAPITSLFTASPSLDSLLRKFWEIEEVDFKKPQDPDDVFCEDHFVKTHTRDATGRYIVRLPFKSSESNICNNRNNAFKHYVGLERRFSSKPEVREEYQKFFTDYEESGHMTPASTQASYIIPHFPVFKATSSTTKIRAVFHGSYAIPPGVSLNQVLHKGPKLQEDICTIISQFRSHAIPVCADIKQMYRQVLIHPDDRSHQHIFWKPSNSSEVIEFELNTVTYGLTPSAFQAQRAIKQLAIDHGNEFPLAANSIQTGIYIDDVITGANTLHEALELQQELIHLFQKGGFELRKWTSNCQAVLDKVPNDHLEVPLTIDADDQHTFKILGLFWDSNSDSFGYSTAMIEPIFSKRALLSNIARIFDPLGWLAPLIFWAKHLLQLLWRDQYDWDQPLSSEHTASWESFISQLSALKQLKIPRYMLHAESTNVELIGFCDSSSLGYAAVLYLRVSHGNTYKVSLLKGKSKLLCMKNVLSIPKAELQGATLLIRLLNSVSSLISQFKITSIQLFSDSTIVLCWLKTAPHLLEVFVANRVVEILRSSSIEQWHHVPSEINPADCASRGLLPNQLVEHSLWWNGPDFLYLPIVQWPLKTAVLSEPLPGLKSSKVNTLISSAPPTNTLYEQFQKFSSLTRITRTFSYVHRFITNLKRSKSGTTPNMGPLLVDEIESATFQIIRIVQQTHFSETISSLRRDPHSKIKGNLSSLTPFLDQMGLLRVGGRLKNAPLAYDSKHPLLLPAKTHLSDLLCEHYHLLSLHGGPRVVQSLIQQKYWIVSLRNLVKKHIHKCVTCVRFNANPRQPFMADLPRDRFSQVRAFLKVGVDFGGPFDIKEHSRRNARSTKGYLCLFVCLSVKAVHLEAVPNLDVPSFLAAFDRFISRRGLPTDIYSDNGTNFVGSHRYLQDIYKFIEVNNTELHDHFTKHQIRWHFNPPSASNFGGLFEAGIKSAKHHLKRILANRSVTFLEFSTLLCRTEQVMNSRPLIDTGTDPHDLQHLLTPGHFLIGAPLLSTPEQDVSDIPMNRLARWQLIQQQLQSFWKLWSRDYLHSLIKRPKWNAATANLRLNDIVIIKNQSTSPLDWPLGRVIDVFPGSDGVIRVVRVRTAKSTLTRPVNKLLVLHQSDSV